MADKPYLFPHPEQKRAYYRFCDSLASIKMERLIEMIQEMDKKTEDAIDAIYLQAVWYELKKRATAKIKELQGNG